VALVAHASPLSYENDERVASMPAETKSMETSSGRSLTAIAGGVAGAASGSAKRVGSTTSDVRATVLSCLSQAESFGEIVSGSALTILAKAAGMRFALLAAGALLALAGVTAARFCAERTRHSVEC
jgi:hypothetical protein